MLGKMAEAKNVREALDSFKPPHAAYKALKAKLAEARGGRAGGGPAGSAPARASRSG